MMALRLISIKNHTAPTNGQNVIVNNRVGMIKEANDIMIIITIIIIIIIIMIYYYYL